jgi:hypothetical protein
VSVVCGSSLSHKCIGKSLSLLANPAMKWFLNVQMALSAVFCLWIYGGASWYSTSLCVRNSLSAVEHSLSRCANLGVSRACLRLLNVVLYASKLLVLTCF